MDLTVLSIVGFIIMLVLIMLKVHIAFALGSIGLAGLWYVIGPNAFAVLKTIPWAHTAKFELAVLPLFILMGMFIVSSGVAVRLFDSASKWFGNIRGGLLIATTVSVGLFGACSGSSIAAATTFTMLALPRLLEHKYDPGLSGGAIAASGTQAALIPPSALLVFYGILTELSIGQLLVAAVIPGIISVALYMLTVWVTLIIWPEKGPGRVVYSYREKFASMKGIWPIPVIFFVMIGGLFFGIFTPSEAGAIGAISALAVALITVGWKGSGFFKALKESAHASAMIFIILLGAFIFAKFIAVTRVPNNIAEFLANLNTSATIILIIILFIYLLLGCVLDAVGMIALTIPVVYPIIELLGINGIWFGILLVKVVEIGLITPPIGINVFVVKGVAGSSVETGELFKGIIPFLIADIVTVIILLSFPELTLWLPSYM
jgi:tripartite ATP-independent transporter DctM subunit